MMMKTLTHDVKIVVQSELLILLSFALWFKKQNKTQRAINEAEP